VRAVDLFENSKAPLAFGTDDLCNTVHNAIPHGSKLRISVEPRQPCVWGALSLTQPLPQPPTRAFADALGHVMTGGSGGLSAHATLEKAGLV
jgi:hypothetical protein